MAQKNKAYFLSSAQASVKSLDTGRATFLMQNPIEFPDAQVGLVEFSFTNFFINISAALANNKLYYSDDALDATKYTITIPDGSYSLSALNDYITSTQQAQVGVAQIIFSLIANYSTNTVGIQFGNVTGWYVSFSAGTCWLINGFTLNQFVPASKNNTAYYIEYGANVAAYNNITSIQVSLDLTTDTISNGKGSSIIYQTTPIAEVGSTQSDRPNKIIFADLTNSRFSSITVQLTDQNGVPLRMSEDFSITLLIRY